MKPANPVFIYLIRPARPGFFKDPTESENAIMAQHFDYLKKATASGQVLLAGPCLDETFGVIIFQAANKQEADLFMQSDPSVSSRVMLAELHPLHVSLIQ